MRFEDESLPSQAVKFTFQIKQGDKFPEAGTGTASEAPNSTRPKPSNLKSLLEQRRRPEP